MGELATILTRAANLFGSAEALVWRDVKYTYADLDNLCGSLAAGLEKLGIERHANVVLHLSNSLEWVLSYYALARLGAVVVPANIVLTSDEICAIVKATNAAAIIGTASGLAPIVAKLTANLSRLPILIGVGATGNSSGINNFEALLYARPVPARDVSDNDAQSIYYTSGTTDRPKGAVLAHKSVHLSALEAAIAHQRGIGDTALLTLPLSHVYGNFVLNSAMLTGVRLVLFDQFSPRAALSAIQQNRVTVFDGVPATYHYMLADGNFGSFDLRSLRVCTIGGQPTAVQRLSEIQLRFGCPLLQLWGMTEIGGPGATQSLGDLTPQGSIGRSLPSTETQIMNFSGQVAAAGEVGELMVRGPQTMLGYFGNREATAEVIQSDGWLRTGDVAYADAGGALYIIDRKKDVIISKGYKIYPSEVEQVLSLHDAVAAAAVVAVPNESRGEVPKAFVVVKRGTLVTEEELLLHCRQRLAPYKVPRFIEFIDELPVTASGKLIRRKVGQRKESIHLSAAAACRQ